MSTERELTPGGPTEYHTISFADLAATLQLNGGISLIGKAFQGMCGFAYNLKILQFSSMKITFPTIFLFFFFFDLLNRRACVGKLFLE